MRTVCERALRPEGRGAGPVIGTNTTGSLQDWTIEPRSDAAPALCPAHDVLSLQRTIVAIRNRHSNFIGARKLLSGRQCATPAWSLQ